MKVANWITEAKDADSQESREIYALAGLALYMAQVLEHGIANCLVLLDVAHMIERRTRKFRGYLDYEKYIDDLEAANFRRTLGGLIREMKALNAPISDELYAKLTSSLAARNRLTHHFFREHALDFLRPEGRRLMAGELERIRGLFETTDRQLESTVTGPLKAARGISNEEIAKFTELMKQGASEAELRDYIRRNHPSGRT